MTGILTARAAKQREGAKDAKNNPKINLCDVFAFPKATRQAISRRQGWLTTLPARSEYRSADADQSRALGDGDFEIVAHTHGELGKRVAHLVLQPIS